MDQKFSQLETALNTILNIIITKDIRLKELRKIEEYADGLIYLTEKRRKLLFGTIKAFRYELKKRSTNEECIGGFYKILKEILSCQKRFQIRCGIIIIAHLAGMR